MQVLYRLILLSSVEFVDPFLFFVDFSKCASECHGLIKDFILFLFLLVGLRFVGWFHIVLICFGNLFLFFSFLFAENGFAIYDFKVLTVAGKIQNCFVVGFILYTGVQGIIIFETLNLIID